MLDHDTTITPPKRRRNRKSLPVEPRFWAAVDKNGPIPAHRPELGPCWLWTRAHSSGYGQLGVNGDVAYAHRISYELHYGAAPDGLFICHHCDNHGCVNPAHLFAGTSKDNQQDMMRKGRGNKVVGIRAPTAKLDPDKVREIRRLLADGVNRRVIAALFRVAPGTVDSVRRRKTWREVD